MAEPITHARFVPHVGSAFVLGADDPVELTLEEAEAMGGAPPPSAAVRTEPFALLFAGPPEPLLPQATYTLRHAELGELELFLVPVGRDERGCRYEAVFS